MNAKTGEVAALLVKGHVRVFFAFGEEISRLVKAVEKWMWFSIVRGECVCIVVFSKGFSSLISQVTLVAAASGTV